MELKKLECGHTAPVKHLSLATWCPSCNELALVVEEKALVGAR